VKVLASSITRATTQTFDRLRAELGVGADSGDGNHDSAAGDYDDEDDDDDDDDSPGMVRTPGKTPRTPGRAELRSGSDA